MMILEPSPSEEHLPIPCSTNLNKNKCFTHLKNVITFIGCCIVIVAVAAAGCRCSVSEQSE